MPPGCSLNTTVRQMFPSDAGRTHASTVIAVVRSRSYAAIGLPGWGALNVAVSVELAAGTVTVCAFAPPSDHAENALEPCGDGVSTAYLKPTIALTVNGVVLGIPSTVTVRPVGTLWNVRLNIWGTTVTDVDAWMQPLSVA